MDREQVDALFARADRAIEESYRLRGEVRSGLDKATIASARMLRSLEALRARPDDPPPVQPSGPWSMAPLRAARLMEVIEREDADLQ